MNVLITGGAGFIGSNLSKKMTELNHKVICLDNMSLGKRENVSELLLLSNFKLIEHDVNDISFLEDLMNKEKIEIVFHLAANSDIQKSATDPTIEFRNTFSTTYNVLESMRNCSVKKLFFASTSAVYGEKTGQILSEDVGDLKPISYYGGAKLASEAFLSSYAYMNDMDIMIFRFPNVIGPNLTHGVLFDFIDKLNKNPKELTILGDGTQCKPYIYVDDLVEAIVNFSLSMERGIQIYNLGVEGATSVNKIADFVCEAMGLTKVEYCFTGGKIGWKGDVPQFQYDLTKIHSKGWKASYTSDEAVKATLKAVLV